MDPLTSAILIVTLDYAVAVSGICMIIIMLVWMAFNVKRDENGNLSFKRNFEEFVIAIGCATTVWIFFPLWPVLYTEVTNEITKREMKIQEIEFVADCEMQKNGFTVRDYAVPTELKCVNGDK